jgi:hypothetical protein
VADYYPLIGRAVAALEDNTVELRCAVYERARTALVAQLSKRDPPSTESEIRREQSALEQAIRKLEAEQLSRLAQTDDALTGKLNELVLRMRKMRAYGAGAAMRARLFSIGM